MGGVHTRTHVYWGWHPLQGVYLHNWGVASTSAASTTGGCTFIAGGVHTRTHVYWGGIHYRGCTFITGGVASTSTASTTGGCTFIAGGVHTRTHVYWEVASTTGGVPSLLGGWHPPVLHPLQGVYLHCWGCGIHQCCIHYRGCTFITGGVASTSAASTTGGCTFIAGGVHTRTHVYWEVASTTGGVPSLLGGWHPPVLHPLQGVYLHCWGCGIHQCCIHYRGCTFITGGLASTSAASTTGGVP